MSSITRIVKRNGTLVPYDQSLIARAISKAGASAGEFGTEEAEKLAAIVEAQLNTTYASHDDPSVEDIQDMVEETLITYGHARTARAYIIYRNERAMEREGRATAAQVSDNVPYKKIYDVLRWNMDHDCETIEGMNNLIASGGFPDLVADSNDRYNREVALGGERVLDRMPDVRMVIIAGPSSSGKTTTTIKMEERLKKEGLTLKAINVDHYFFDLEMHPKDEFGDYDYETPQALDLELINEHFVALLNGETIKTPHYDFKTGTRELGVHEMHLADNEILLVDSLHGLYDMMSHGVPARNKFRLYIETLGQLRDSAGTFMRWSDNRLLRRMIRDSWHRNLKPLQTLTHWHYVRRSELKNIIPFIGSVDYVVNSALPYELPILKDRLFKFFPEAIETYKDDPKRQDAYIRAQRIHDMLEPLTAVSDDSCIPDNALLREFIGGSTYAY